MWLQRGEQNKNSTNSSRIKKWYSVLLWMPCLVVLLFSTCITEAIGVTSRLFYGQPSTMGGKYFPIPAIWIVNRQDSRLSAMTVPGIARIGIKRYWHTTVPISEMVFIEISRPEDQLAPNVFLDHSTVLAKRTFPFGSETLNCWDLIHHNRYIGPSPKESSIADISCTTESDRFYAHFNGWRGDSNAFYKTLQSITFAK